MEETKVIKRFGADFKAVKNMESSKRCCKPLGIVTICGSALAMAFTNYAIFTRFINGLSVDVYIAALVLEAFYLALGIVLVLYKFDTQEKMLQNTCLTVYGNRIEGVQVCHSKSKPFVVYFSEIKSVKSCGVYVRIKTEYETIDCYAIEQKKYAIDLINYFRSR